ncbi:MAG: GNAT family N-acetyltransferase [Anaerolineae bacterium]
MPTRHNLPHYRPLCQEDLAEAWDLLAVGLNQVRASVNRPPLPKRQETLDLLHHLLTYDPEGCWGVEVARRLEGICLAALREQTWFLSHFWVRSDQKQRGLGRPLLQKVWDYGQRKGATLFATHASPDLAAHALYTRFGMDPVWPVYRLEGNEIAAARFVARWGGSLEQRPFDAQSLVEVTGELTLMDRAVRKAARVEDHRFWLQSLRARAVLVHERGGKKVMGYGYALGEGELGPILALAPEHLPHVIAQTIRTLLPGATSFHLYVPGPAVQAMRALLEVGFRAALFNVFFSSAPFPHPAAYIPSGPDLW